jgi:putative membrane protein insertion efficiency factor
MKSFCIFLIRVYQKFISPLLPHVCRFYPTCSRYAIEVFREHGFFVGFFLTAKRIFRCNPLGGSGIDLCVKKKKTGV